mgnify:CR=1 FL=1
MNERRQPPTLPLIALLVVVFAAPACASMQQRVTESENRSNTLEAQVADLQANQQNIISRLAALRATLEDALDPIRAQQAFRGGADLRALEAQVATLSEQVRQLTTALAVAQAAAATTPTTAAPTLTTPMPAAGGGEPSSDPDTTAEGAEDALFNSAYADYSAGQFIVAVSGFEEFLVRHPGSARAADALYWIAESLAAQDLHDDARRRFLEVTQAYPGSPNVPDAVLRAALEAVELGLRDAAIRELRQLIAAYRGSDTALIGCMQLDRLGQSLPAGCQFPSR